MDLGEFIKQKRLESGMTQQELYAVIPTSRTRDTSKYPGRGRVSKIESGKQEINFSQLQAIAQALGQAPSEFLREYEAQQMIEDLIRRQCRDAHSAGGLK